MILQLYPPAFYQSLRFPALIIICPLRRCSLYLASEALIWRCSFLCSRTRSSPTIDGEMVAPASTVVTSLVRTGGLTPDSDVFLFAVQWVTAWPFCPSGLQRHRSAFCIKQFRPDGGAIPLKRTREGESQHSIFCVANTSLVSKQASSAFNFAF